ncbi:amidohydrolase family protein [Amycolatopsis acidicola]|uniref:Amidohydrolase family protein n=1 Tax=Amycolatopsis acidicola TaxID=2596893 RepID=A0A5N0UYY8_9PSEU|nr:amidohydrolase family protein [Amycolatopsis acidicola]KAA9156739.1 amidohydrolase family protein [Amycolatopsis acidicola]
MLDLVIKGGTVVDGLGSAAFEGDVGVRDGVITAVGKVTERARRTLDAAGAIVTPGFVDAHTHYDGQVTWDDELIGSASNGVTTAVLGNCGVGFAPVRDGGQAELIDLMEGVEDIPGTALHEGIPWGNWETFAEYLDFLRGRSWSLDIAAQLPHGPLRHYVMGERGYDEAGEQPATAEDVAEMARLAHDAAQAGAVGFSTSRILFHRGMSGRPVPGTFAPEAELLAIAEALYAGGAGTVQAIPANGESEVPGAGGDPAKLLEEVRMLARISRKSGVRCTFTTSQHSGDPGLYREVLATAAAANVAGARLSPMVMPRAATVLTTLGGYHLFMRRPTYLRLAERFSGAELVAALRDPAVKSAILAEPDHPHERPGSMQNSMPPFFRRALPRTFRMTDPVDYEPPLEKSLASLAATAGRAEDEYLYDFLLEDEGTSVGMYLAVNYVDGNLDAAGEMLADPNSVSGLSDAGAHVNFICDMSVPTFHLAHWVRDRTRGERLPIELVVAKITAKPAETFGLTDRGALVPGRRADVNILDLDRLAVRPPKLLHDLPAGGSRFIQPGEGYVATVVRGVPTRLADQDTGERPGRLAR